MPRRKRHGQTNETLRKNIMKTVQILAASILTLSAALPTFALAQPGQSNGDATTHVVQPQASARPLQRDVVLMAIEAAAGKGQFNSTAGDATAAPQIEPSRAVRKPTTDMSRFVSQHMGDAT
jgi:hypothetical protein